MPCCVIALLALFGPRLILVGIWLFNNAYLSVGAANNFLLQCLGFIFLPWTLLAYVFSLNTFGAGQFAGLEGTGLVITLVGFIIDLASYGGSGYGNRDRISGYMR